MTLTFVEATSFTASVEEYFVVDQNYLRLQSMLLRNPETGVVIPGTGGLRKVRWPDLRRGKGKRSGLRVIYLHVPESQVVVFLDVYDKDESEYLSPEEKRALAGEVEKLRDHFRRTR